MMIRKFFKDSRTLTFAVCLLVAIFLWIPMKLSRNLLRDITVPVVVTNLPTDKVIVSKLPNLLKLSVEADGFSLLKSYSQNPVFTVDFADLQPVGEHHFCLNKNTQDKLSNTYFSNFKIRAVQSDTLYLVLAPKHTKKIPVVVHLNVELFKEYQLTELLISPDSLIASGNAEVLDTLKQINFQYRDKKPVKSNFSKTYTLNNTPDVQFNTHKITMEAFVDKVSEQLLKVPVQVEGVPAGSQVKIFPDEVTVLCTGDLNILKTLSPDDIEVKAAFADAQQGAIPLQLSTKRKRVKVSFYQENTVDFLIRKQ